MEEPSSAELGTPLPSFSAFFSSQEIATRPISKHIYSWAQKNSRGGVKSAGECNSNY